MANSSDSNGWAGWIKWAVGVIIALLAAGGGIVALLNYQEGKKQKERDAYYQALEKWENHSPGLISEDPGTTVRSGDRIDFETGRKSSNPDGNTSFDLLFGCWANGNESLRALPGVSWFERGVVAYESIKYREIRSAAYQQTKHRSSGKNDLYYAHKSNVPGKNHIFFIKTKEGNLAVFQILDYEMYNNNPAICRDVKIRYKCYPIQSDLPKPVAPY